MLREMTGTKRERHTKDDSIMGIIHCENLKTGTVLLLLLSLVFTDQLRSCLHAHIRFIALKCMNDSWAISWECQPYYEKSMILLC